MLLVAEVARAAGVPLGTRAQPTLLTRHEITNEVQVAVPGTPERLVCCDAAKYLGSRCTRSIKPEPNEARLGSAHGKGDVVPAVSDSALHGVLERLPDVSY